MNSHFHSMFLAFWKQFGNKSIVKETKFPFFWNLSKKKSSQDVVIIQKICSTFVA